MNKVQRSDIGRVRTINEDLSYVQTIAGGYTLAIVADGMGGHKAGDIASRLAVDTVAEHLRNLDANLSLQRLENELRVAILRANRVIYELSSQDMRYYNMGTTIVAALLNGTSGVIAHIGDSRIYKIRHTQLLQLTQDHSLVNELLKSGQITNEEAEHHPRKNVLTRALGTDPKVTVDMSPVSLMDGEVLLLCSDGLSNRVTEEQMTETIASRDMGLDSKADCLVQLALEAGGADNITVVLLEQTSDRLADEQGGGQHDWT